MCIVALNPRASKTARSSLLSTNPIAFRLLDATIIFGQLAHVGIGVCVPLLDHLWCPREGHPSHQHTQVSCRGFYPGHYQNYLGSQLLRMHGGCTEAVHLQKGLFKIVAYLTWDAGRERERTGCGRCVLCRGVVPWSGHFQVDGAGWCLRVSSAVSANEMGRMVR